MTAEPKVSWLMPVKNGMPYLSKALASIEAQSFRDFEVLVWDNGSTDGTVEELQRWIPHRLPGKIVTGQPLNLGASRAALVKLSRSEFCALLDADDLAVPSRLQNQVDYLRAHPDIAVLGGNLRYIDSLGNDLGRQSSYPLNHESMVDALLVENPIGQPSVLCRRQAVLDAGNYLDSAELSGVEDYELWMRMAARFRFANLPDVLTQYRIHERSTTQTDLRANLLQAKRDKAFVRNSGVLFDWDMKTSEAFCASRLKFMLPAALKLATRRAGREGSTWRKVMQRPRLLDTFRGRLDESDFVSDLGLALMDPRKGIFSAAVRRFFSRSGYLSRTLRAGGGKLLQNLPWGRRLLAKRRERQEKQKFIDWLTAQRMKGSFIHEGLTFKGKSPGYPNVSLEDNLLIERDVTIWISDDAGANPSLTIGADTFIGFRTFLGAYQALEIGRRVLIGANCYLITANHRYDRRDISIRAQGFEGAPIVLEDDVWLGTSVTVLPGVKIGRGAIIGAGSVVNRNVPAWEVWGGVPAKFLKQRPE